MNFHRVVSLNGRKGARELIQTHPYHYVPLNHESVGLYSSTSKISASTPLLRYIQSNPPNFLTQVPSTFQPQKNGDSIFCTRLHSPSSSSVSNSEIDSLPHLSVGDPFSSSFLLGGEVITSSNKENLDNLVDFLDITAESSDQIFQHLNLAKESLTLKEKLGLLSRELLDLPVDDVTENATLDHEMYEVSQVSSIADVKLDFNRNYPSLFTHIPPEPATSSHTQRMRWTTELHDRFVDAVDALGGPEAATPKSILGIMNVEGLHIYHVKSHLQKYRDLQKHPAPKNLSELKHDKRASSSSEKKATPPSHDKDGHIKSDTRVTEAWRKQIEVQKLLHERLMVQKELQLRIEQNGELLIKLMEEHQKVISINDLPSFAHSASESEPLPHSPSADVLPPRPVHVRSDCYLDQTSKRKVSVVIDPEESRRQKRLTGETNPEVASPDTRSLQYKDGI